MHVLRYALPPAITVHAGPRCFRKHMNLRAKDSGRVVAERIETVRNLTLLSPRRAASVSLLEEGG